MKRYKRKIEHVEAIQLTVNNLYEVEKWCGGQIKGTEIPIKERVIDIWSDELDDEMRAEMGDWIIKDDNKNVFVYNSTEQFNAFFEETK